MIPCNYPDNICPHQSHHNQEACTGWQREQAMKRHPAGGVGNISAPPPVSFDDDDDELETMEEAFGPDEIEDMREEIASVGNVYLAQNYLGQAENEGHTVYDSRGMEVTGRDIQNNNLEIDIDQYTSPDLIFENLIESDDETSAAVASYIQKYSADDLAEAIAAQMAGDDDNPNAILNTMPDGDLSREELELIYQGIGEFPQSDDIGDRLRSIGLYDHTAEKKKRDENWSRAGVDWDDMERLEQHDGGMAAEFDDEEVGRLFESKGLQVTGEVFDQDRDGSHKWCMQVTNPNTGKSYRFPYHTGSAVRYDDVTEGSVLSNLVSDSYYARDYASPREVHEALDPTDWHELEPEKRAEAIRNYVEMKEIYEQLDDLTDGDFSRQGLS